MKNTASDTKVPTSIKGKSSNKIFFERFHTKLYFPFLLDIADPEFISRDFQLKYDLLGKQGNWESHKVPYRNFFPHFGNKFYNPESVNESEKLLSIVKTYRFKDHQRKMVGLNEDLNFTYLYSVFRTGTNTKPLVLPLKIKDIYLHFFETGVIFLEFNFTFHPKDEKNVQSIDFHDVVRCLYRFKELRKEAPRKSKPSDQRNYVVHEFSNVIENGKCLNFYDIYDRIVHQSFDPIFEMKPYQTNDGKDAIGHFNSYLYADMDYATVQYDLKPNLNFTFNELPFKEILNHWQNPPFSSSLQYILGYGANMYADEYLIEPLRPDDYIKTYIPYYFRMDGNGAINFVTRNKKRPIHFLENEDGHYASWQQDYALIFLYLLHERYALMQYTSFTNSLLMEMERFHPKTELERKNLHSKELEKMSERLLLFVGTYNKFMIRLDVEIASKHEHTNRVYHYYKKQLFIDDLIEDIYYKIDHFKSYSDTLIKEQQISYQEGQRRRTKLYGIGLAAFSVINALWGVVSGFDWSNFLITSTVTAIILFVLYKVDRK